MSMWYCACLLRKYVLVQHHIYLWGTSCIYMGSELALKFMYTVGQGGCQLLDKFTHVQDLMYAELYIVYRGSFLFVARTPTL